MYLNVGILIVWTPEMKMSLTFFQRKRWLKYNRPEFPKLFIVRPILGIFFKFDNSQYQ